MSTYASIPDTMHAWAVATPGSVHSDTSLELVERPVPSPGPGELLVHVRTCGVCRTDLHVVEGDLDVHHDHVTPGHEVVGTVVAIGSDVAPPMRAGAAPGDGVGEPPRTTDPNAWLGRRVGAAWLRSTCGTCKWCRSNRENLCPESTYTGWDADGGYAEYMTVPAAYAYELPAVHDVALAPLLCAGIIGYHALLKAELPRRGTLGLYGFGGSAHLCAQLALAAGATVHVLTRGQASQQLALELGAKSAAGAYDAPPEPLDAAVLFAPVGDLVPTVMRALDRGGVLSIAGIHLSDIPTLNYEHELFYEKQIRSVTSNTRAQGREFLELAARHDVRATTHEYPMSQGLSALRDLKDGKFDGAAVLVNDF